MADDAARTVEKQVLDSRWLNDQGLYDDRAQTQARARILSPLRLLVRVWLGY
jgi:hypothetical protein